MVRHRLIRLSILDTKIAPLFARLRDLLPLHCLAAQTPGKTHRLLAFFCSRQFTQDSMLDICAPLCTAYPHCRNSFKALEKNELPLLCAIFHLEDARSRTGLMSTIPYYADVGATASVELAACIQAVMDYVSLTEPSLCL